MNLVRGIYLSVCACVRVLVRRARCSAEGCREKLSVANRFECKACGAIVCLKHRFGPDHQCEERQQRVATLRRRASSMLAGRFARWRGNDGKASGQRGKKSNANSSSSCIIC